MKKFFLKIPKNINFRKASLKEDFDLIEEVKYPPMVVDRTYQMNEYGFPLSLSELETAQLHISTWKEFLKSDDNLCVIVEENVDLEGIDISAKLLEDLPSTWDVFFPYEKAVQKIGTLQNPEINPNRNERVDIQPYYLGFEWGTSIYFLSKKGCQKLTKNVKEIKQRIDDEMLQLAGRDELELYYSRCEWLKTEAIHPKVHVDRLKMIKHAVLNYSVWTKKSKTLLHYLLDRVSKVGQEIGAHLLLQGGSHLGYVRHGGVMEWDDDVDIGIEEDKLAFFLRKIENETIKVSRCIEQSTGVEFYKVWSTEGVPVPNYDYGFPLIDIWLYNVHRPDIIFKNGIICPNSAEYPLERVEFEGSTFYITGNSLEVLDSRYKDWKNMIRIYGLSHAQEKSVNHILSATIKVDNLGKMIEEG